MVPPSLGGRLEGALGGAAGGLLLHLPGVAGVDAIGQQGAGLIPLCSGGL